MSFCATPAPIFRAILFPLIILALVMIAAGRLPYWQRWVCGASNVLSLTANPLVLRGCPDLVAERLSSGEGMCETGPCAGSFPAAPSMPRA